MPRTNPRSTGGGGDPSARRIERGRLEFRRVMQFEGRGARNRYARRRPRARREAPTAKGAHLRLRPGVSFSPAAALDRAHRVVRKSRRRSSRARLRCASCARRRRQNGRIGSPIDGAAPDVGRARRAADFGRSGRAPRRGERRVARGARGVARRNSAARFRGDELDGAARFGACGGIGRLRRFLCRGRGAPHSVVGHGREPCSP